MIINFLNYLKKLVELPTPKEMGMESNALGMKEFTPFQDGPMWEDYDILVKKKHPIKFWLNNTLPRTCWWPIKHRVQHIWYWLQCHFVPWRYNFYKINLKNVDSRHPEKYGYLDPCDTLKLAAWYCIIQYIEKCQPQDPAEFFSEDDLKESWAISQKADFDEAVSLYTWWTKDRHKEYEIVNKAYKNHNLLNPNNSSKERYDEITKIWLDLVREQEEKEEEMFLKVCKLRQRLWT